MVAAATNTLFEFIDQPILLQRAASHVYGFDDLSFGAETLQRHPQALSSRLAELRCGPGNMLPAKDGGLPVTALATPTGRKQHRF